MQQSEITDNFLLAVINNLLPELTINDNLLFAVTDIFLLELMNNIFLEQTENLLLATTA